MSCKNSFLHTEPHHGASLVVRHVWINNVRNPYMLELLETREKFTRSTTWQKFDPS